MILISPRAGGTGKEVSALAGCEQEFVGIYGNDGVYAGSPGKPGPLKQVIGRCRLPQAEIDDLRAGIVCHKQKMADLGISELTPGK